jgi:hypothetical protein
MLTFMRTRDVCVKREMSAVREHDDDLIMGNRMVRTATREEREVRATWWGFATKAVATVQRPRAETVCRDQIV